MGATFHALWFPGVDNACLQLGHKPSIITGTTMLHIKQPPTEIKESAHDQNNLPPHPHPSPKHTRQEEHSGAGCSGPTEEVKNIAASVGALIADSDWGAVKFVN